MLRLIIFPTQLQFSNTVLIFHYGKSFHFISTISENLYLLINCFFLLLKHFMLYPVSIVTNELLPNIPKLDISHIWLHPFPISFLESFNKTFASFHDFEHTVFFLFPCRLCFAREILFLLQNFSANNWSFQFPSLYWLENQNFCSP